MEQLILHALGDFVTQTGFMARFKKVSGRKGFLACIAHCTVYSLPFLLIGSVPAVAVIFLTHFAVDRTQLVQRLIALREQTGHTNNFGFPDGLPPQTAFWLYVAVDNTIHLICNYAALALL
jgi:hypothetical protein